jgi:hypothetical protein
MPQECAVRDTRTPGRRALDLPMSENGSRLPQETNQVIKPRQVGSRRSQGVVRRPVTQADTRRIDRAVPHMLKPALSTPPARSYEGSKRWDVDFIGGLTCAPVPRAALLHPGEGDVPPGPRTPGDRDGVVDQRRAQVVIGAVCLSRQWSRDVILSPSAESADRKPALDAALQGQTSASMIIRCWSWGPLNTGGLGC